MSKLQQGVQDFKNSKYVPLQDHFEGLKDGQSPHTLFITCSDSRIDPHLITNSKPGELFMSRNAGNIVTSSEGPATGEASAIEYAVSALGVQNIVVCGHSGCGAMGAIHGGVADPSAIPVVVSWLKEAGADTYKLKDQLSGSPDEQLTQLIQRNVVLQLEHLKQHPCVAKGLEAGKLTLIGWVYDIGSGTITEFDATKDSFHAIN